VDDSDPGPVSARDRTAAALIAAFLHLAVLAPLADGHSVIVGLIFQPEAEAILDGALPYRDRDFEYPPLAVPVLLAPALVSDQPAGYGEAFAWEMIGFDLAIVALLAFWLRASSARIAGALVVYTLGVFALSGALLPNSVLDASLPLARFDLVPAALVLAALLAREAGRSVTWSALLSLAGAVKAYPLLLYPVLLRGEARLGRVALAALVPLAVAAGVVLAIGDEFASAIGYHAERQLQIETVAATPLLLAHLFGAPARIEAGGGSYNLDAPGSEAARAISLILLAFGYALVVWIAWRWNAPLLPAATAVLAVAVAFAPVLSPQFLLWLLPVSAAAFGLRVQNLVLLAAVVLTAVVLARYDEVGDLSAGFVIPLAARNGLLLAFLALAVVGLRSGSRALPGGVGLASRARRHGRMAPRSG
jgi:Glycosyltransferase family 87